MLVQGKFMSYNDDIKDAYEIRKNVFQIEQGINPNLDFDQLDKLAVHVVIYTDNKAVATGRLVYDGDNYMLSRIAVLKEERGNKYGDFVVRMLIDRAFISGANEVLVASPVQTVEFYKKIGFEVCGEEYMEDGVRYKYMKLKNGCLCKACKN